jgi:hypothetical protein
MRTRWKFAGAVALAVGLCGQAAAAPVPARPPVGAPAIGAPIAPGGLVNGIENKTGLPTGTAPVQVLASLDKDGKLVVKNVITTIRFVPGPGGPGAGPGVRPGLLPANPGAPVRPGGGAVPPNPGIFPVPPGGGFAPGRVEMVATLQTRTFDLSDVKALDNRGKMLGRKDLARLLKGETLAMASLYGQEIDPLHLRVLKDGVVTFILPSPRFNPRPPFGAPGGVPVPLPAPLPGGAPGGAGGIGIAVPGIVVPANPAPNR